MIGKARQTYMNITGGGTFGKGSSEVEVRASRAPVMCIDRVLAGASTLLYTSVFVAV